MKSKYFIFCQHSHKYIPFIVTQVIFKRDLFRSIYFPVSDAGIANMANL